MCGTLYSGFASFRGDAATKTATMLAFGNGTSSTGFTNNPYGEKAAFSAGAEVQLTIPTKSGFVFSLETGFESLTSSTGINYIWSLLPSSITNLPATGKSTLTHQFISIFPSVGYKINARPVKIDLKAGVVIAPCLKTHEEGSATTTSGSNQTVTSDMKLEHPKNDLRPSLQTILLYKKFGNTRLSIRHEEFQSAFNWQ